MSESVGPSFVHLHLHTQYTLLGGAIRVSPLMKQVKEWGMPAVAMTDTHNLFGAVDFYLAAKAQGLKPILGCELLYAPEGRFQFTQRATKNLNLRDYEPHYFHLVVLCKNLEGYRNLCQMITKSYLEAPPAQKGMPSGPREFVDRELLDQFGEGLIVLSGGFRSEIAYKILQGKEEEALETVKWFQERFKEDFYLELLDFSIPENERVNETLYAWGEKYKIQCVATANSHYLQAEDAEAQEILQCISTGRNLDFDRPKSLVPTDFRLKSAEEMRAHFERFPGACDNTLKVAEKCQVEFQFKDKEGKPIYHLPDFRPDGVEKTTSFDTENYFREQSRIGLKERIASPQFVEKVSAPDWPEKQKQYEQRFEEELEMIVKTGFSGYFLIVADFINWAKKQGIPVGPGRGSGAGSIVAYSLGITDIDPIEFNLLFERFINPERVSMPDFDVDFCQDRRGEVISYVERKYGKPNVSQIITFGKLQARAVIKDVGRVLGMSFAETDQLTKLLPDELNITLTSALEKEPALREKINSDPKLEKVFQYALKLEGLYRNTGIHAAGVIITENPIVNYCPLSMTSDGDVVTMFDKDFAEKIGLVKFDFLGLKTLTVIDQAVKLIKKTAEENSPEKEFSIDRISYREQKVFDLISSGDTDGVFQVESSGMKDLCSRLKPSSVEDLTAINALYRPGPLGSGMVDDFIDRKHGRMSIEYELDLLEPILRDTYGVILYQEQVMQIARELAGYTLGQADMLRRAMGKKKADEMARHREFFVKGATAKGIDSKKAESIFDLMAKFAEYGFNKSHSAAYAVLTYQTAFLKTFYPAEFMAALMTTEINNTDKITKYIADARAHQISVLPPDVNFSSKQFSVEVLKPGDLGYPASGEGKPVKAVRFGLEAIKGVGGIAVDCILDAREGKQEDETPKEVGPFSNLINFCKRVSTRKVNKKVFESLTMAGAFDSIAEVNRASVFESIENLLNYANDEQAERELGQASLFDAFSEDEIKLVQPTNALFKSVEDWPTSKKLSNEKQVVGFYVSGHPMDAWQSICEDWLGWSTQRLKAYCEEQSLQPKKPDPAPSFGMGGYQRPQRKEVQLGGLISECKEITTKKGSRMAFLSLEDLQGKVELIVFPEPYSQFKDFITTKLSDTEPVLVTGELDIKEDQPKILVRSFTGLREAHESRASHMILKLKTEHTTLERLRELKKKLLEHRGRCTVSIAFEDPQFHTRMELPEDIRVSASPQLVRTVNQIFGADVVHFR